jgi:hypothetical protein
MIDLMVVSLAASQSARSVHQSRATSSKIHHVKMVQDLPSTSTMNEAAAFGTRFAMFVQRWNKQGCKCIVDVKRNHRIAPDRYSLSKMGDSADLR